MRRQTGDPAKKTINLAQEEQKLPVSWKPAAMIAAAVLILAAFVKFGIADPLLDVAQTKVRAADEAALLAQTNEKLSDYNSVLETYQIEQQTQPAFNGSIDAMDCLSLIENQLIDKSEVSSFTVADDTITVKLSGVTLNDISAIYQGLMSSVLVSDVQVYTASANEATGTVTASMTIALTAQESASGTGASS